MLRVDLQQAVDGLGLDPGLLGHALGRAACGSRQEHPHAFGDEHAQDRVEQGCLADTGTARHHRDLGGEHQLQRLALRGREGLARPALHPGNSLVEVDLGPGRLGQMRARSAVQAMARSAR